MNYIWMKKPAGWAGELWRESLPVGNGLTSALLCGSVGCEHLWVNRYDRWDGGAESELPDVHEVLGPMRKLIVKGCYSEANGLLSDALCERGYEAWPATPAAPVEIRLRFESEESFRCYRRGINMDTGEAFVQFKQGAECIERRAFVSRSEDQVVLWVRSTGKLSLKVDLPDDQRLQIVAKQTGGELKRMGDTLIITDMSELLLFARFDKTPVEKDYQELLEQHLPLYRKAMGDADLKLSEGDHNTEVLLDEAVEDVLPVELCEKLWRFGRYLFVSGTAEGGNPFPLYGLWNGLANLPWAQNVARVC